SRHRCPRRSRPRSRHSSPARSRWSAPRGGIPRTMRHIRPGRSTGRSARPPGHRAFRSAAAGSWQHGSWQAPQSRRCSTRTCPRCCTARPAMMHMAHENALHQRLHRGAPLHCARMPHHITPMRSPDASRTRPCCPRTARRNGRCLPVALVAMALALTWLPGAAIARDALVPGATAGLQPDAMSAAHWIDALAAPDQVLRDHAGIQARNARVRALDPSIHDLATLPHPLPRAWVRERIIARSSLPTGTLYDARGDALTARARRALQRALALDAIPLQQPARHGLVVRRADLRTFPTAAPAHSSPRQRDIDRFQESALFPGDAVAVLHRSRDGEWLFVASERYLAWIAAD